VVKNKQKINKNVWVVNQTKNKYAPLHDIFINFFKLHDKKYKKGCEGWQNKLK
jgi:hypothetical protein